MTGKATEVYRPARQARSARSEKLLLDAAESLFAENGYQGTRVTDIIERSGCSTGTFYHRFKDKDELARVMIRQFIAEETAHIQGLDLSRATHGSLRNMLIYLGGVFFDTMSARLGVFRASQRLNTLEAVGEADTGVLNTPLQERMLAHLDDYSGEITAADPALALTHALQLLIMVTLQTRLRAGRLFPKERDALIAVMVQAALGILRGNEAP